MADTALAVIPARLGSTRLPGKPLLDRTGKPLIQHVVERVRGAHRIGRIVVATDDERIVAAVEAFGGEAMLTRADHANGTSRIAEAVERLAEAGDDAIVVNVQGDEPEVEPAAIDALVDGLAKDPRVGMATLASEFAPDEDPADGNIVKVVTDVRGRALYFSRAVIPHHRDGDGSVRPLKHAGLYAYRRGFLMRYAQLEPTPLEQAEKLEQLRALEHGETILVVRTHAGRHGIDTPEQYEAFVRRVASSA
ncbi:MAG: 3-deoxy-manno-octulosonate cytidylyltransferase [Phycisphaeraceae bacterium]